MLYQCNYIGMRKTPVHVLADWRSNLFVSFDMVVLVVSFSVLTGCIASCDYFPFIWLQSFCNGACVFTVEELGTW